MERGDERLEAQLLGEARTRREGAQPQERGVDLGTVPPVPVLVCQPDESVGAGTRVPAGVLEHEQGRERLQCRPARQEVGGELSQPDGVGRPDHLHHVVSSDGCVAGGEGEVDRARHVVEPVGPAREVGDDERHLARREPSLGAGEPRGHGRGRHDEEARDVSGRHTEHEAQREGGPDLGGEHRVGGHEQQGQALVDVLTRERVDAGTHVWSGLVEEQVLLRPCGPFAAERVDDPAARDRADPAGRVVGDGGLRPLGRRVGEGAGERVLDEVRTAEPVHELPEQPAPVGAPDLVEGGCTVDHQDVSTAGAIWMS